MRQLRELPRISALRFGFPTNAETRRSHGSLRGTPVPAWCVADVAARCAFDLRWTCRKASRTGKSSLVSVPFRRSLGPTLGQEPNAVRSDHVSLDARIWRHVTEVARRVHAIRCAFARTRRRGARSSEWCARAFEGDRRDRSLRSLCAEASRHALSRSTGSLRHFSRFSARDELKGESGSSYSMRWLLSAPHRFSNRKSGRANVPRWLRSSRSTAR